MLFIAIYSVGIQFRSLLTQKKLHKILRSFANVKTVEYLTLYKIKKKAIVHLIRY